MIIAALKHVISVMVRVSFMRHVIIVMARGILRRDAKSVKVKVLSNVRIVKEKGGLIAMNVIMGMSHVHIVMALTKTVQIAMEGERLPALDVMGRG